MDKETKKIIIEMSKDVNMSSIDGKLSVIKELYHLINIGHSIGQLKEHFSMDEKQLKEMKEDVVSKYIESINSLEE